VAVGGSPERMEGAAGPVGVGAAARGIPDSKPTAKESREWRRLARPPAAGRAGERAAGFGSLGVDSIAAPRRADDGSEKDKRKKTKVAWSVRCCCCFLPGVLDWTCCSRSRAWVGPHAGLKYHYSPVKIFTARS